VPLPPKKRAKINFKSVTGAAFNATPLAPGYKLDRYELLCPIAEGGMASLWVARQRGKHGFAKLVAIKTILPKFAADVRFQEMFLDEARIASRIEHPNVAQIFDLGEENEILYLVMEYVEGDALSKLNRACQRAGTRIPNGVILRVLADACAGLHEAHDFKDASGAPLEIVHRDVSPHNILVSSKGTAKLIDFGIATARSRAGAETSSGVLKGKIQYMAPEQALGQRVDRRADIWAVGAILYTLLAGKPPFEGENPLATLHLLGSGRPPMPLPSAVHPAISTIVRRAMSFTPDQRYATAAELRDAIERAMVAAQCTTTVTDVATFATEHLADRMEKRRHAIDAAIAAAEERERLNPPADRRSASVMPRTQTGSPPWPPPSSGMLPSPLPQNAQTRAEGSSGKPATLETLSRLTARVSETPPQVSSYATLGSAALDTSIQSPKSRKGFVAVAGAVVLVAVAAAAVSFNAMHPRQAVPAMGGPNEGTAGTGAAKGAPAMSPLAPPPTPESPGGSKPTVPTVEASSLPKVQPPPLQLPLPPRRPISVGPPVAGPRPRGPGAPEANPPEPPTESAPGAPQPPPAPASAKPTGSIDDGF
jgi:serine/threonine protein kinase